MWCGVENRFPDAWSGLIGGLQVPLGGHFPPVGALGKPSGGLSAPYGGSLVFISGRTGTAGGRGPVHCPVRTCIDLPGSGAVECARAAGDVHVVVDELADVVPNRLSVHH